MTARPSFRRNPKAVERAQALVESGAITKERACFAKVAYSNRNDARHAAKGLAREVGRPAFTYKCHWDDHWHISKSEYGEDEE